MNKLNTILFGFIGARVETSQMQRQPFNVAVKEAKLDRNWDVDTYKLLLMSSGGR